MRRRIAQFIAMMLICCLCTGMVAQAKEPIVENDEKNEEITEPGTVPEKEQEKEESGMTEENKPTEEVQAEKVQAEEDIEAEESGTIVQEQVNETEVQNSEPENITTKEVAASQPTPQKINPVPKSKKIYVLLVGNSLTYRKNNTTITNLRKLAKKSGRKLVLKRLTYSNEKMKNWADPKHKNGKRLYREIRSGRWDYIVFQEQTDASVKKSFVSASKKVSNYIHSKSPKTQIVYNCTWAYKKGKKISGKYYSFSKMQNTMNKNYESAAAQTGGRVCWSGKAFLAYRKTKGKKKNLYLKDNNHGSKYGWYLNACCLYTAIFGHSPTESKYYAGLSKKQAKLLQKIATMQHL